MTTNYDQELKAYHHAISSNRSRRIKGLPLVDVPKKPIRLERYGYEITVDDTFVGVVPIDNKTEVKQLIEKLYKKEYVLKRVKLMGHIL